MYVHIFFSANVLKSVLDGSSSHGSIDQISTMSPSDSSLVSQYKDLIREQDCQIQNLNKTNETLLKEKQNLEVIINYFITSFNCDCIRIDCVNIYETINYRFKSKNLKRQ